MITVTQVSMVLGAAAVALGVSLGLSGGTVEASQSQAAPARIEGAFAALPKSDRLAPAATVTSEACREATWPYLGRICTAHLLASTGGDRPVRFITLDRSEKAGTTILEKVPVAH